MTTECAGIETHDCRDWQGDSDVGVHACAICSNAVALDKRAAEYALLLVGFACEALLDDPGPDAVEIYADIDHLARCLGSDFWAESNTVREPSRSEVRRLRGLLENSDAQ